MKINIKQDTQRSLGWRRWRNLLLFVGLVVSCSMLVRWLVARPSAQLIRTITTTSSVNGVQWSLSGELLLSAQSDGSLQIWQADTGTLLRTIQAQQGDVYALAISSDGLMVASGGSGGSVAANNDARLARVPGPQPQVVQLWNIADGALLRSFTCPALDYVIRTVALSDDQRYVAAGGSDGAICLWDRRSGMLLHQLQGHVLFGSACEVNSIAFNAQNTELISGGYDGTVQRWNVATGAVLAVLEVPSSPNSDEFPSVFQVAFSQDGRYIIAGAKDSVVSVWRVADDGLEQEFGVIRRPIWALDTSPNGERLATGSGTTRDQEEEIISFWRFVDSVSNNATVIHLWRTTDYSLATTLKGHTADVESVAFSPDSSLLASGSRDHTIRIWSLK